MAASPRAKLATHQRAKQASLAIQHPDTDAAITRFQTHPDMAFRLALARELAQTRSQELTLAYRNVVAVVAGWRRKRTSDGGHQAPLPEPCVVLVVKKKWPSGEVPIDVRQTLPRHLLVGAEVAGQRQLFAVPTDVQLSSSFLGGKAYGSSAVWVSDPVRPDFGTITCAVEVTRPGEAATQTMVLSAMHVFTPFAQMQTEPATTSATVLAEPHRAGASIGVTSMLRGYLRASDAANGAPEFSFDAQLADLSDRPWLTQQLQDMPLSGDPCYVTGAAVLDQLNAQGCRFFLHAANNHPTHGAMQIALGNLTTDLNAVPLAYRMRVSGIGKPADPRAPLAWAAIYHWELLQFDVLGPDVPVPGDSGAPVLAQLPDGSLMLVGMFIAGHFIADTYCPNKAYVLPAWQLFWPSNWGDGQVQSIQPVNL